MLFRSAGFLYELRQRLQRPEKQEQHRGGEVAQCLRKLATPQIKREQAAAVDSECQQDQAAQLDAAFGEELVVVHWEFLFSVCGNWREDTVMTGGNRTLSGPSL